MAVGRAATGQMSPTNLAPGKASESARRGRRPGTRMAVFVGFYPSYARAWLLCALLDRHE